MDFLVEEYEDKTLRIMIPTEELSKNGYDVWACVGKPFLLDAFISRLIDQLITEEGLVLKTGAKAGIYMLYDMLIINFPPNTAHFEALEEYKNSEQFQKDLEMSNSKLEQDIQQFLKGEKETSDADLKVKTIYSIRSDLDTLIEVCHILKRQEINERGSILYKDGDIYKLDFIISSSPLLYTIIERDLADYILDMTHYEVNGKVSLDYGNEHMEVIIKEDAINKLNKVWNEYPQ